MSPVTWLGWLLAVPVAGFLAAALCVGMWLNYLEWRRRRQMRRAIAALKRMIARGAPNHEVDRARAAVDRMGEAGDRYRAACRRWGVEP